MRQGRIAIIWTYRRNRNRKNDADKETTSIYAARAVERSPHKTIECSQSSHHSRPANCTQSTGRGVGKSMPRINKEPVECWKDYDGSVPNCRFLVLGENQVAFCKRNPKHEQKFRNGECFAGEPIVERSCENCTHPKHGTCSIQNAVNTLPQLFLQGWHCSDWEAAE